MSFFPRKSNPDALNNGLLVDFNIFEMSLFSCLPESEINMVKRKLELAIYQAKKGYVDPGSFVIAVNAAMLELQIWVEEHWECCGLFRSSCGTCFDFESAKLYLESIGFEGQDVDSYDDGIMAINFRDENPNIVVINNHDFTVEINGDFVDVQQDLITWSVEKSKFFTPLKAEMRFLSGSICGVSAKSIEAEQEELIHAFAKIYAYLLVPPPDQSFKKARLYVKVRQSKGEATGQLKLHLLNLDGPDDDGTTWDFVKMPLDINYFLGLCGCRDITILNPDKIEILDYKDGDIIVVFGLNDLLLDDIFEQDRFATKIKGRLSYDFVNYEFDKWKKNGFSVELTDPPSRIILIDGGKIKEDVIIMNDNDLEEGGSGNETNTTFSAAFYVVHGIGHMSKKYYHSETDPFDPGQGFMADGGGQNILMDGGHWTGGSSPNDPKEWISGPGDGLKLNNFKGLILGNDNVPEANTVQERKDVCNVLK